MRDFTIHSDGTPQGFTLVDSDGNVVEGIYDAKIEFEPNDIPRLTLSLYGAGVNAKVHLSTVWYHCIDCGELIDHDCPPQTISGKRT